MKFLLSFLLTLFLASMTCFASGELIFSYDFNGETAGNPPPEPWKPTEAGEIVIDNFPSAVNKSVKITDSGSGGGMALILDEPIMDKTVTLEYKFLRVESTGGNLEIFYVMNQNCPDDWSGVCAAMTTGEGGVFQYHNNAWVDTNVIENNVWHTVKCIMYIDRKEYDLIYDGEPLVNNAVFRKYDGVEGIDKFNVANVGNGGSTFVMYFDDIMLYEGTTPPTAVEPQSKLTTTWGCLKNSR